MTEDELQQQQVEKEQKKAQHQRNAQNNAQALRVAAQVAQKTGNPYAVAIGKAVSTADKLTGGKSSELVGHVMSRTQPKMAQNTINKAADSGALAAADKIASSSGKKSGDGAQPNNKTPNANSQTGDKTPGANKNTSQKPPINGIDNKDSNTTTKEVTTIESGDDGKKVLTVVSLAAIFPIVFFLFTIICLVVLIVSFFSMQSNGSFAYGITCPTVTVTDTGCNGNAENCTHVYDGDVAFEDYVAGVVAAEVGSANNLEYYKIWAISARTFFLNHVDSSCTVKGNASYQVYMDVEDSPYAETIKQAVEETKGQVLVKNEELAPVYYASACVVDDDDEYYYVRYGTLSLGEANYQKIPKEWDNDSSNVFKGYLSSWYSKVDQNDPNLETKSCPSNHDYGMSALGALYLIIGENYNYEEVFSYYFGDDSQIMVNKMQLNGVDGFVNPTRKIYCTSPFGPRIHPVSGQKSNHTGLDIGIAGGEPIYAAADGVVKKVVKGVNAINNCSYGYGNNITIEHADGMSTLYAHIKYGSIPDSIEVGTQVSQGEQIGQVGSTGCSTGNHLHYEVMKNGNRVDPTDYMDLTNAAGTCKR